uniref:Uncharacterized protein n=1 Tax=Lactuca sativa TaxID=4236 RepID=A0A9R1UT61_LACSA|nr:hypothetical protein LSAT_V11C800398150 [Lactuca sativa]
MAIVIILSTNWKRGRWYSIYRGAASIRGAKPASGGAFVTRRVIKYHRCDEKLYYCSAGVLDQLSSPVFQVFHLSLYTSLHLISSSCIWNSIFISFLEVLVN